MSDSNSISPDPHRNLLSEAMIISDDGAITHIEGEPDYSVRPIPPERMARAIAERDLIARCLAEQKAKDGSADH